MKKIVIVIAALLFGGNLANAQMPQAVAGQPASAQTANQQVMPNQPYPVAYPGGMQVLPQQVQNYITTNFPGAMVVDVDWDDGFLEVKLNNWQQLYFDYNGNFVGQWWDD